jgi:SPASM domain peptide maturase of grasp-with-spasm system
VNIELFTEAQKHNTCLNKKLSLDINGEIRICPSMKKSYGNIKDTLLKNLISNTEIKKVWGIDKNQIEVCKDCEFRYICTDCRAFLAEPENRYSKPLKCNYNPYKSEWVNVAETE